MSTTVLNAGGPRSVHVLDIENLLGGVVTHARVAAIWAEYQQRVPLEGDDAVFAGFCPATAPASFALPGRVRVLVGTVGPDSADAALTALLDVPFLARRYQHVYIGSGDHYFAPSARALTQRDVHVVVVLGEGRPAADLYRSCNSSIRLQPARAQSARPVTPTAA